MEVCQAIIEILGPKCLSVPWTKISSKFNSDGICPISWERLMERGYCLEFLEIYGEFLDKEFTKLLKK